MSSEMITVDVFFDADVSRWVASSEDVSGLHVEADSVESLFDIVDDVLPDLIESNLAKDLVPLKDIPYHIMHERVAIRG